MSVVTLVQAKTGLREGSGGFCSETLTQKKEKFISFYAMTLPTVALIESFDADEFLISH